MSVKPLRLLAQSPEDLKILSAMVQDAAIKVGDLAYLPQERRFAATLNRYRWEASSRRLEQAGSRVRSGLHIDYVLQAKIRDVPRADPDHVMVLLAITAETAADETLTLTLTFGGGAAIQLLVECVEVVLDDLSRPWTARAVPDHSAGS